MIFLFFRIVGFLIFIFVFFVLYFNFIDIYLFFSSLNDLVFEKTFYSKYVLHGRPCDARCLEVLKKVASSLSDQSLNDEALMVKIREILRNL